MPIQKSHIQNSKRKAKKASKGEIRLWGFRSGKPWHMVIAVIWYILCAAVFYFSLTAPCPVPASSKDIALYRLNGTIISLWMFSPAVFLSRGPVRDHLMIFRGKQSWFPVPMMMLVFVIFACLFAQIENFHSPEYKMAYTSYIERTYQGFVDAGSQ